MIAQLAADAPISLQSNINIKRLNTEPQGILECVHSTIRTSCLQGPVSDDDSMHHTCNFMHLVCHLANIQAQGYSRSAPVFPSLPSSMSAAMADKMFMPNTPTTCPFEADRVGGGVGGIEHSINPSF